MAPRSIPAAFMRGGTSKAVMVRSDALPGDPAERDRILCGVMGSPDAYGRQLDGMGGGISSLSKVCIVGPAARPDADVDYTFGQVLVREARIDYTGNCGNMSSAVGPYAVREGLVRVPADGMAAVRIHNTNTGKMIRAVFAMRDGDPVEEGDLAIDGVHGTGAPVRLEFLDPGGSSTGRLLPAGPATDLLALGDGTRHRVTMIDASTPCVLVAAADLGLRGTEPPAEIEAVPGLMRRLEEIRRAASLRMGLAADAEGAARKGSVPKVAMLAAPADHPSLSGAPLAADGHDLVVRMVSMGNVHLAVPITGAICLAAAARTPGTLAARLARLPPPGRSLRIAHPSGVVQVDAEVDAEGPQGPRVLSGAVLRSARLLFEGRAFYR